jgi:hypothetical protein
MINFAKMTLLKKLLRTHLGTPVLTGILVGKYGEAGLRLLEAHETRKLQSHIGLFFRGRNLGLLA